MTEPGPTAEELRALIPQRNALVILGVQRSGTNLLAKDIAALGDLGRPGEHLLKVKASGVATWDQAQQFAALGAGERGDTFAVTLMVNYLDRLGRWVAPPHPQPEDTRGRFVLFSDLAIRFFVERFDRVTFLTLDREPLWEWAYSHWRLTVTNQYHREGDLIRYGRREVGWIDGDPVVPDPAGILDFAHQIQEKRRQLVDLVARNGIEPLPLTYREVVDEFPDYLHRVTAAAGLPDRDLAGLRRQLTKLVPPAELAGARDAVRSYLGL